MTDTPAPTTAEPREALDEITEAFPVDEISDAPWIVVRGSITWMIQEGRDGPQVGNFTFKADARWVAAQRNAIEAEARSTPAETHEHRWTASTHPGAAPWNIPGSTCADPDCPDRRSTPAEALDVSPEELRSRAKDIRDEFRADEAENGLDAALAHIALALAQAEARLPFDPETERIVRQTLAIVDQTTPLSVGEPLVQLILARLRSPEPDR